MSATHSVSAASPRLAALQQAVAAGDGADLEAFWAEVAARGAPLIEPLEGDPRHRLVTFLWRAVAPLDNVVVMHQLSAVDSPERRLEQLPGTDVWQRSYRVRADVRTTYQFAPNDSLVAWDAETD